MNRYDSGTEANPCEAACRWKTQKAELVDSALIYFHEHDSVCSPKEVLSQMVGRNNPVHSHSAAKPQSLAGLSRVVIVCWCSGEIVLWLLWPTNRSAYHPLLFGLSFLWFLIFIHTEARHGVIQPSEIQDTCTWWFITAWSKAVGVKTSVQWPRERLRENGCQPTHHQQEKNGFRISFHWHPSTLTAIHLWHHTSTSKGGN